MVKTLTKPPCKPRSKRLPSPEPDEDDKPPPVPKRLKVDPYATGVLDPEAHERLVADIARYAEAAGITVDWLWKAVSETCGPDEVAWVKRFRFHPGEGCSGLVYVGKHPFPSILDRMSALAAVLTRNFIYARVMTLNHLLDAIHDGETPAMSCLLVPNFFTIAAEPAGWRLAVLLDGLLERHVQGLQTVLYVADLNAMSQAYGVALRHHLEDHFKLLEV
jgi:hypothetical protein